MNQDQEIVRFTERCERVIDVDESDAPVSSRGRIIRVRRHCLQERGERFHVTTNVNTAVERTGTKSQNINEGIERTTMENITEDTGVREISSVYLDLPSTRVLSSITSETFHLDDHVSEANKDGNYISQVRLDKRDSSKFDGAGNKHENLYSLDSNDQRIQVSSRLLHRRKTIEVDKDDLSGIETKHTSYLNFILNSGRESKEPLMTSEVNIIWGKTIDTEDMDSPRLNESSFRSECKLTPSWNRSLDDSTDYWSADVSTDTFITSDSNDIFTESGDTFNTSDYNESFLERSNPDLELLGANNFQTQSTFATAQTDDPEHRVKICDISAHPFTFEGVHTCTDAEDLSQRLNKKTEFVLELGKTCGLGLNETRGNEDLRLGSTGSAEMSEEMQNEDKMRLFKVSDNIAFLGRGLEKTEPVKQDHHLSFLHNKFSDHIPSASCSFSSGEFFENSVLNLEDNTDKQGTNLLNSSGDDIKGVCEISEVKDSNQRLRTSQEDIRDIKYETGDSLTVRDSTGSSYMEAGGELGINQRLRASQEDIRDIKCETGDSLTVRDSTGSSYMEAGGELGIYANFADSRDGLLGSGTTENKDELENNGDAIKQLEERTRTSFKQIEGNAITSESHAIYNCTNIAHDEGGTQVEKATGTIYVERCEEFIQEHAQKIVFSPRSLTFTPLMVNSVEQDSVVKVDGDPKMLTSATASKDTPLDSAGYAADDDDGFIVVTTKKKSKKKNKLKSVDTRNTLTSCDESSSKEYQGIEQIVSLPDSHHSELHDTASVQSTSVQCHAQREETHLSALQVTVETLRNGNEETISLPGMAVSGTAEHIDVSETTAQVTDTRSEKNTFQNIQDSSQKILHQVDIREKNDAHLTGTGFIEQSEESTEPGSQISETSGRGSTEECVSDREQPEGVLSVREAVDERINTDEFLSRILEGTDVRSMQHMDEFLHSEESSGVLLNIYTGGHRRILKPHRRFPKPTEETKSKSTDISECKNILDSTGSEIETLQRTKQEECPVEVVGSVTTNVADVGHRAGQIRKPGNRQKQKSREARKHDVVLSDSSGYELNVSGGVDNSFENLDDIGASFDMFLGLAQGESENGESCANTTLHEQKVLFDEPKQLHTDASDIKYAGPQSTGDSREISQESYPADNTNNELMDSHGTNDTTDEPVNPYGKEVSEESELNDNKVFHKIILSAYGPEDVTRDEQTYEESFRETDNFMTSSPEETKVDLKDGETVRIEQSSDISPYTTTEVVTDVFKIKSTDNFARVLKYQGETTIFHSDGTDETESRSDAVSDLHIRYVQCDEEDFTGPVGSEMDSAIKCVSQDIIDHDADPLNITVGRELSVDSDGTLSAQDISIMQENFIERSELYFNAGAPDKISSPKHSNAHKTQNLAFTMGHFLPEESSDIFSDSRRNESHYIKEHVHQLCENQTVSTAVDQITIEDKEVISTARHNSDFVKELSKAHFESGKRTKGIGIEDDKTENREIENVKTEVKESEDERTEDINIEVDRTENREIENVITEDGNIEDDRMGNKEIENVKTGLKESEDEGTEDIKTEDGRTENREVENVRTEVKESEDEGTEDINIENDRTDKREIENVIKEDRNIEDDRTGNREIENVKIGLKESEDEGTEDINIEVDRTENREIENVITEDRNIEDDRMGNREIENVKTGLKESEDEGTEDIKTEDDRTENREVENIRTVVKESEDEGTEDINIEDDITENKEIENVRTEVKESGDEGTEDINVEDDRTDNREIENVITEVKESEDEGTEDINIEDDRTEDINIKDNRTENKEIENVRTEVKESEDEGTEDINIEDDRTENKEIKNVRTEVKENEDERTENREIEDKEIEVCNSLFPKTSTEDTEREDNGLWDRQTEDSLSLLSVSKAQSDRDIKTCGTNNEDLGQIMIDRNKQKLHIEEPDVLLDDASRRNYDSGNVTFEKTDEVSVGDEVVECIPVTFSLLKQESESGSKKKKKKKNRKKKKEALAYSHQEKVTGPSSGDSIGVVDDGKCVVAEVENLRADDSQERWDVSLFRQCNENGPVNQNGGDISESTEPSAIKLQPCIASNVDFKQTEDQYSGLLKDSEMSRSVDDVDVKTKETSRYDVDLNEDVVETECKAVDLIEKENVDNIVVCQRDVSVDAVLPKGTEELWHESIEEEKVKNTDKGGTDQLAVNEGQGQTTEESESITNTNVNDQSAKFVDRHEEMISLTTPVSISKRLLKDVMITKARAEQLVQQNQEASKRRIIHDSSSSSTEPPLTPAGHLMSEMALLETSAREQCESLHLAVTQHERYKAEIHHLHAAIAEAQMKLQASPVTATTVAALKQQMLERNVSQDIEAKEMSQTIGAGVEMLEQSGKDKAESELNICQEQGEQKYFKDYEEHFHSEATIDEVDKQRGNQEEEDVVSVRRQHKLIDDAREQAKSLNNQSEELSLEDSNARELAESSKNQTIDVPSEYNDSRELAESSDNQIIEEPSGYDDHRELIESSSNQKMPLLSEYTDMREMTKSLNNETIDIPSGYNDSRELAESSSNQTIKVPSGYNDSRELAESSDNQTIEVPSGYDDHRELAESSNNQTINIPSGYDSRELAESSSNQTIEVISGYSDTRELTESSDNQTIEAPSGYSDSRELTESSSNQTIKVPSGYNDSRELAESSDNQIIEVPFGYDDHRELTESSNNQTIDIPSGYNDSRELSESSNNQIIKVPSGYDDSRELTESPNNQTTGIPSRELTESSSNQKMPLLSEYTDVREMTKSLNNQTIEVPSGYNDSRELSESSNNQTIELLSGYNDSRELAESSNNMTIEVPSGYNDSREMVKSSNNETMELPSGYTDAKEMAKSNINMQTIDLPSGYTDVREIAKSLDDHNTELLPVQTDNSEEQFENSKMSKQLADQIPHHIPLHSTDQKVLDREMMGQWKRLSRDLVQRKQSLETFLKTRKPEELVTVSQHAQARSTDLNQQLVQVKTAMVDLASSCSQLQKQPNQSTLKSYETLTFQKQYHSTLQNISSWLDEAQHQLFIMPSTIEEQMTHNKNLQEQMRSLQEEVKTMNHQANALLTFIKSDTGDLIETCANSVDERIKLMEKTAALQAETLSQAERQYRQYQDRVKELQKELQTTQKLILIPTSSMSVEQLLSINQKIEAQLKKCENSLEELKGEKFLTDTGHFREDFANLYSEFFELHKNAMEKKSALQNLVTVQDQYQKMLRDYTFYLEIAKDKLQSDCISANDLNHLKQQLAEHKDFFSDLEMHKAMLNSLLNQCDPATKTHFQQQHSEVSTLTYVIVDQAGLHKQRLERIIHQWTNLNEKQIKLQNMLSAHESRLPQALESGDSVSIIKSKVSKYKQLQSELAAEKDNVFKVVEYGTQILHSVNCPALEKVVNDLMDKWICLTTDLARELRRSENLADIMGVYEKEITELLSWLRTTKMKLASLKQVQSSDLENIGTVRHNLEKVLELRKEMENHLPLKNKIIAVDNQLIQTGDLVNQLEKCEKEWKELEKDLMDMQEVFYHSQMKLMPSRQALTELTAWIEEIENSLQKDRDRNTIKDSDIMVKKYKGYKLELESKQMILDFVNQNVLTPQPGKQDTPNEKREFVERLRHLNTVWQKVVIDVNSRLNALEGDQNKKDEYEKASKELQAWLREQKNKIKTYKLFGLEADVKQSLKNCKAQQQELQSKRIDLDFFKAKGNHLIELSHDSQFIKSVQNNMNAIDNDWKILEEENKNLENLLLNILNQWTHYHSELAYLNKVIVQSEYALNHYVLTGGDVPVLRSQVQKLKDLIADFKKNLGRLESFSALVHQLGQVCEQPVKADIDKTLSDIQSKWKEYPASLSQRCNQFEHYLDEFQVIEDQYTMLENLLHTKEAYYTDFSSVLDDPQIEPEVSAKFELELDDIQTGVSDLHAACEKLMENMNPSTISVMMSRQMAVEQRLLALRQILSGYSAVLIKDTSMFNRFREAIEVVQKFLSYAESILVQEDPTKASEKAAIKIRLDKLKQLIILFSTNFVYLDAVNDFGYRLALNETDATELKELNHTWYRLLDDARDRSRMLQGLLLQQQDFTKKYQSCKAFLAQSEQDLATVMKGNLSDLNDQLYKCEKLENEMDTRHHFISDIFRDEQKMTMVEDDEEGLFQQNLYLLFEQWQNVSSRTSQKKADIKKLIQKWQLFYQLNDELKKWLKDKEDSINTLQIHSDSLQVIRNLTEKVQAIRQEFRLQETTLSEILNLGNYLLTYSDQNATKEIKDTQSQLKNRWTSALDALSGYESQLQGVDQQWLKNELEIEDMQDWLKNVRSFLQTDIPITYDELHVDIDKCRDIAAQFIKLENWQQHLASKEKLEGKMVHKEDTNLLYQRIRLLTKQWQELQQQIHSREQKLSQAVFRWRDIDERISSLKVWTEDLILKVIANMSLPVEDILYKLENEYKQEVEGKELEKNRVVEEAKQLLAISSEVQASDLEHKLEELEEKWHCLKSCMNRRQEKLKETLLSLKQLDTSMNNLNQWLSVVENEMSGAVMFQDGGFEEMQAKLKNCEDLQQDIHRQSAGVASVLQLCELLLHDPDACHTENAFRTLKHTMKTLSKRWLHICALSPQQKTRIEEAWQQHNAFRNNCEKFSEWMTQAEQIIRDSEIEVPSVKTSSKSIKIYEDLQLSVLDHLSDLEQINRQYCQFVKEGCIDPNSSMKIKLGQLNDRWDALQLRVTEIMKKLVHSSAIREDFEVTLASLTTWLTEIDMQLSSLLTSNDDLQDQAGQILHIQDEIHTRNHRIQYLDQAGMYLMQKGDSQLALTIQQNLDEFRQLWRAVQDRVAATRIQINRNLITKVENGSTSYDNDNRNHAVTGYIVRKTQTEQVLIDVNKNTEEQNQSSLESGPVIHGRVSSSHSQNRTSPVLQRQKSPSPPARARSPSKEYTASMSSESSRRKLSQERRHNIAALEKSTKIDVLMEHLVESLDVCNIKLARLEKSMGSFGDSEQMMQSLMECETAIKDMQALERLLKTETGLTSIDSVDASVKFVLRRWEQLQRRAEELSHRKSLDSKDFVQFTNDIELMLSWLDRTETLLSEFMDLPSNLSEVDAVGHFNDFMNILETKKTIIQSINARSANYLRIKTAKTRHFRGKLQDLNRRWGLILSKTESIHRDLQCLELNSTIDDYQLWLDNIEAKVRHCEPGNFGSDESALYEKHSILVELRKDLEQNYGKVLALKDTADHLLEIYESPEVSVARDKMYIMHQRMDSLIGLTEKYISSLNNRGWASPKRNALLSGIMSPLRSSTTQDRNKSSKGHMDEVVATQHIDRKVGSGLLLRVFRAALPILLLLLLLLLLPFFLIPVCEDDEYNCLLKNNFQHSFSPVLQYTDGAPPI